MSLNITIKKTPNSFITFASAGSMSSTVQDKLLQKATELKMEGRNGFTQRQKTSPVTLPSTHDFGPRPTL